MEMINGWLVCLALVAFGWLAGGPLIIGFLGSLAFGATAIASAGGATIPAYVALSFILALATASSRNFLSELGYVLRTQWLAQLVGFITLYAVATSYILPRLFAGNVDVVIPVGTMMARVPLGPTPGNINQAIYFVVDGLVFFTMAVLLMRQREQSIYTGLLFFSGLNAALGLIDVLTKLTGAGDLLAFIRTSGYAMLVDQDLGGFFRVIGGFPEASAYAASAIPSLAFSFIYWRNTQSRLALAIALVLLALLLFSTSSTAYISLAVLFAAYGTGTIRSLLSGRISVYDIGLFLFALFAVAGVLFAYLVNQHSVDPFFNMLLNATVNKVASDSAVERGSWNQLSIDNLFGTYGVGVGLGSTRSSSWALSILAQLGVIGGAAFLIAVGVLISCLLRKRSGLVGDLAQAASGAALAGLVALSAGGGNADPGVVFFVALASAAACLSRSSMRTPVSALATQEV